MYLTLIKPSDATMDQIQQDVAAAHSFVISCFDCSQMTSGSDGRMQYHVGDSFVLVRSPEPPPKERMDSRTDLIEWKSKEEKIPRKKTIGFRMRLNAAKRTPEKKIKGISTAESREFMEEILTSNGTEIVSLQAEDEGIRTGKHRKGKITLRSVMFSGFLNVSDHNLFETMVKKGIGRGKAWGFGMLMVK